ncbi:hypothetical protein [Streptomyces capitiformicae]|uniref:Secreted protein n=1 Tax=Streptomyces capitiformicae TaxID=2014920 RepID=A0A919GQA9_9ACTN|nr:hypothetical protein [Streptomyces capitiformicae]GHH88394.1 hypothetical protein GCM10017771_33490 [Streptomyces capitiformicae]
MRTRILPKSFLVKSVLAATLSCVVLSGYGAANAAAATDSDAEARFLNFANSITDYCTPARPSGVSEPTDLDSTQPVSVEEVPLTAIEKCRGEQHAERIGEAFSGTGASDYEVLHEKLTALDYPAARIHRMPDYAGVPRARIDLRVADGDHLAVEVNGYNTLVTVEAFGAPEGVSVTDVRRNLVFDPPTF